jgi:uncharacterized protein YuzE
MIIHYDNEVDALYLKLSDKIPEGVVEIAEGINLDTTSDNKIIGIEILDASRRIDINTILTYTIEIDRDLLEKKSA